MHSGVAEIIYAFRGGRRKRVRNVQVKICLKLLTKYACLVTVPTDAFVDTFHSVTILLCVTASFWGSAAPSTSPVPLPLTCIC